MNPTGKGGYRRQDPKERLLRHVAVDEMTGCWLWTGRIKEPTGYGQSWLDGVSTNAHRIAYIVWRGPIPEGLEVDHLCHVRRCINPNHLEAVSHTTNVNRQLRALDPFCKHGHPRTPENTAIWHDGPGKGTRRKCRPCERIRDIKRSKKAA